MHRQYRPLQNDEPLVVVLNGLELSPTAPQQIADLSPRVQVREGSRTGLADARAIYTLNGEFDAADLRHLRLVQIKAVSLAGRENIRGLAADIPVATLRGAYTPAVAELAVAILLAVARHVDYALGQQRQQRWAQQDAELRKDIVLCFGKTVGIVGYGSVGRQIARVLHSMGMTVLACKRNPRQRENDEPFYPNLGDRRGELPRSWFGPAQLARMAAESDILINTLPGTSETRGLIDRKVLEALPAGALLVNVGRGGTVDEAALVDLLESGQLAGAGLDVFEREPLPPDHPLWSIPNVLITPHVGSASSDQSERADSVLIENLGRMLNNRPLINVGDVQRGY